MNIHATHLIIDLNGDLFRVDFPGADTFGFHISSFYSHISSVLLINFV